MNGKEFARAIGKRPQWVYSRPTKALPYHRPRKKHQRYRIDRSDASRWLDEVDATAMHGLRDFRVDPMDELSEVPADCPEPMGQYEAAQVLGLCWHKLKPRERLLVVMRYGIVSQPMTLRAAGAMVGLSTERTRQIIYKAFRKMRKELVRLGLADEPLPRGWHQWEWARIDDREDDKRRAALRERLENLRSDRG